MFAFDVSADDGKTREVTEADIARVAATGLISKDKISGSLIGCLKYFPLTESSL
jgi:hypothetical protein